MLVCHAATALSPSFWTSTLTALTMYLMASIWQENCEHRVYTTTFYVLSKGLFTRLSHLLTIHRATLFPQSIVVHIWKEGDKRTMLRTLPQIKKYLIKNLDMCEVRWVYTCRGWQWLSEERGRELKDDGGYITLQRATSSARRARAARPRAPHRSPRSLHRAARPLPCRPAALAQPLAPTTYNRYINIT